MDVIDGISIIRDPREAAAHFANEHIIGFDTETTGLSPWRDKLALMQFYGDSSGVCAVIQIKNGIVPEELKSLFTPDKLFICHNAVAFDILMLSTHGVPWEGAQWYDTLVGETVCVSTGRRDVRKSLKESAKRRLGAEINKEIDHGHWADEELSLEQLRYAVVDVMNLPALYRAQLQKATETGQLVALQLEQAIMPYVARMTINGLPCKREKILQFIDQQQTLTNNMYSTMVQTFGDINYNSHIQIKQAVRDKYGLYWESTAHDALINMTYDDPVSGPLAQVLLNYRVPAQRLKMYNDEFIAKHLIDDRIHARFWQCSADTGRFTSSDPNLQQVPRDGRWFIGNIPGRKIVAVDLSQIEVRVAAYISGDTELIRALEEDDIHTAVASMIYRVPAANVTKEQRRNAKATVFALLYCGGVARLYNQAREDGAPMTMEEADQLYHAFFGRFTGLWRMRNQAINMAKNHHMNIIRMPSTLRRVLVGPDNRPSVILNSSVQGFAAAGLKQGMLRAGRHGLFDYIGAQVHDELVGCVEDRYANDFAEALRIDMVDGMKQYLPVNVVAEKKVYDYWK